jgi:hypothetical protein
MVNAVNRRGRPARLKVELSRLHAEDASPRGMILVMNLLPEDRAEPPV